MVEMSGKMKSWLAAAAVAAALCTSAGPAGALSAPAEFEYTLAPTPSPVDFQLGLALKRSFADVLTLSALVEPSWVAPPGVSSVVLGVAGSPSFAGAVFTGSPDNPSYELAYFDDNTGDLVLGAINASSNSAVTAFTWTLRFGPQTPPGGTIRATLNVEQLDLDTFDTVLLTGAQTFAAPVPVPVPEPTTWMTLGAGLLALFASSGLRARLRRRAG
jgi:hypothetical protein